jgi:hypothetical protein
MEGRGCEEMRNERLHPRLLLISALVLCPLLQAGTNTRIFPLQTSATFSFTSRETRWSVPIKAQDGSAAYFLSLEPDFDTGHHVVTLELVLRQAGKGRKGPNLFDPTGRLHGLQAWHFNADDLAHGVEKSAYGNIRTVPLKSLDLKVRVVVSDATVSPISSGRYELEAIHLQIDVANWR